MKHWTWVGVPIIALLDQLSKIWVVNNFDYGESESVWGEFFRLTRVHNPGAAFGIFQQYPEVFTGLTAFAIIALCVHKFITKNESILYHAALVCILGGAFGNIIDRFQYNYVVDFINIGFGETRWPAFNIADSSITIGVVLLLLAGGPEQAAMKDDSERSKEAECSQ